MSRSFRVQSRSAARTRELAAALAGVARRGDVVVLAGPLGAGKTTFAQGFARALGVEGPVTSPTFTLVRQYRCELGQLLHADLYRLEQLAEVEDLGLGELVEEGVALVEWGDVAEPALSPVAFTVRLDPGQAPAGGEPADGDDTDSLRTLTVSGADERLAEAAAALGATAPEADPVAAADAGPRGAA